MLGKQESLEKSKDAKALSKLIMQIEFTNEQIVSQMVNSVYDDNFPFSVAFICPMSLKILSINEKLQITTYHLPKLDNINYVEYKEIWKLESLKVFVLCNSEGNFLFLDYIGTEQQQNEIQLTENVFFIIEELKQGSQIHLIWHDTYTNQIKIMVETQEEYYPSKHNHPEDELIETKYKMSVVIFSISPQIEFNQLFSNQLLKFSSGIQVCYGRNDDQTTIIPIVFQDVYDNPNKKAVYYYDGTKFVTICEVQEVKDLLSTLDEKAIFQQSLDCYDLMMQYNSARIPRFVGNENMFDPLNKLADLLQYFQKICYDNEFGQLLSDYAYDIRIMFKTIPPNQTANLQGIIL